MKIIKHLLAIAIFPIVATAYITSGIIELAADLLTVFHYGFYTDDVFDDAPEQIKILVEKDPSGKLIKFLARVAINLIMPFIYFYDKLKVIENYKF